MVGKIRVATHTECFRHQAKVLQHHPLLGGDEFRHELLHLSHRGDAPFVRVRFEIPALITGKFRHARWEKIIPLVENERASVFVQNLQQPVDIHERQIVHWQEITCAGRVRRPAIRVDVEQRFARRSRASIFDLYATPPIQLGEFSTLPEFNQLGDFTGGKFARFADEIRRLVIRHDQRNRLQPIAARNRPRHESRHDATTTSFGVIQVRQRVPRDAAGRKHQRRLFCFRQRLGFVAALKRQRPAGNFHAQPHAARSSLTQGGQERILFKSTVSTRNVVRLSFHT